MKLGRVDLPFFVSIKMKLYVISGLGADFKVLEKLEFNPGIEVEFLDWLMPHPRETFQNYVRRMAERIDASNPFYLMGYSFGGIIAQEIHRITPAEKVVILGSIRSHRERSHLMALGRYSKIPRLMPARLYSHKSAVVYSFIRKILDPKNPKLLQYFNVRDSYYLKWSIEKIVEWNYEPEEGVIQILGDRDIVFPIKNCQPDFIIKGGTHLFPATKHREVSGILKTIFK